MIHEYGENQQIRYSIFASIKSFLVQQLSEVEENLQNQERKIFFRRNNILQANIAPKFSRSIPQDPLVSKFDQKTTKQILKTNGYYFSNIETVIVNNDNNTVDINYNIELGEKAFISKS